MGRGWPGSLGRGSGVGRAMSIVRHALLIQPIGIAGASSSRPLRTSRLFVLTAHIATTGTVEKAMSGVECCKLNDRVVDEIKSYRSRARYLTMFVLGGVSPREFVVQRQY